MGEGRPGDQNEGELPGPSLSASERACEPDEREAEPPRSRRNAGRQDSLDEIAPAGKGRRQRGDDADDPDAGAEDPEQRRGLGPSHSTEVTRRLGLAKAGSVLPTGPGRALPRAPRRRSRRG